MVVALGLVARFARGGGRDRLDALRGLAPSGRLRRRPTPVASDVARLLGLVTLAVGSFAALFAALTALFNLLSAIIVMSVAQGCMALVIVLSLMTGLELDLRSKILAERAELRISRVDGEAFGDYEPLLRALAERQELAAASPYVEGEVMLRSDFNRQGALLIGVDPALHRRATGIAAMVREGDYRLLECASGWALGGARSDLRATTWSAGWAA